MDNSPLLWRGTWGEAYYRLKQTDFDGKYEYFSPIAVTPENPDDWKLIVQNYPDGSLQAVLYSESGREFTLELLDMQGKIIRKKYCSAKEGKNVLELPVNDMRNGFYFIRAYNYSHSATCIFPLQQ